MTLPGDPIGSAISGAAQGVAETVTKGLFEGGRALVSKLFGRKLPEIDQKARENVEACGAEIMRRLDVLETHVRRTGGPDDPSRSR